MNSWTRDPILWERYFELSFDDVVIGSYPKSGSTCRDLNKKNEYPPCS